MKTRMQKAMLLFSVFIMLIFISCPKGSGIKTPSNQKTVYKVKIFENEAGKCQFTINGCTPTQTI